VSVSPGSAFGAAGEGMVRVSRASDRAALLEGLARLADLVHGWGTVEVPALDGAVPADS
jgi:aspartate aminotransferase